LKLPEEKFKNYLYSEFLFFSGMVENEKLQNEKLLYKAAAFGAFLSGHGGKSSLSSYLRKLGLAEDEFFSAGQKKAIAKRGLEVGKRVAELFKK